MESFIKHEEKKNTNKQKAAQKTPFRRRE